MLESNSACIPIEKCFISIEKSAALSDDVPYHVPVGNVMYLAVVTRSDKSHCWCSFSSVR